MSPFKRTIGRREALAFLAAAWPMQRAVAAQDALLQYANLDHVSLQVSDVAKSIEFYSKVFGNSVRKENESPRYYVKLGSGYVAMAQLANGRTDARIDHFCAGVRDSDVPQIKQYLSRNGIQYTEPPPFGLFFPDPEGIRVQLWTENSWTDVGRTTSSLQSEAGAAIFGPQRIEELVLVVSDREKAGAYYEKLFGRIGQLSGPPQRIGFRLGQSSVLLAPLATGHRAGVDRFRVAVAPFENGTARQRLQALGATLESGGTDGVIAFRDRDGIRVEVEARQ